jgi:hypothetical protein
MNILSLFKKRKKEEPKKITVDVSDIRVLYSYEWKEEIPESERDTPGHESRPFCKKMVELNGLYTRMDIESISERLGYSVWNRCGGEGCRHRWVPNTVRKK